MNIATIGIITISDRASSGAYIDKGGPALRQWFADNLSTKFNINSKIIADEQALIEQTLIYFCDTKQCDLVVTTGGTGPALRDVTPEATKIVCHKLLPGFGEQMRQISLQYVPTAILSRQVAGIRNQSLIINLPGQPKSINETLDELFAAVPYCLDLIGGAYIETSKIKSFRPKNTKK